MWIYHFNHHLCHKVNIDDVIDNLKDYSWNVKRLEETNTFSISHFWSHTEVSWHGWYMPNVTQLTRITVMVALSNQLESGFFIPLKTCNWLTDWARLECRTVWSDAQDEDIWTMFGKTGVRHMQYRCPFLSISLC